VSRRHPGVDAYIARSAAFARPILKHLRGVVHEACPETEEKLKWGFPHFDYKGMLCSMAAFKAHATFGFWKGRVLARRGTSFGSSAERAMGQFGRLTSLADLPSRKTLTALVKQAMKLNDEGIKTPARARPRTPRTLPTPAYFAAALR
jgi:hypothetical protein